MKLLDCTLRDGGYYTNWDFSKELLKNYFDCINRLPIDYVEIGFRSITMKGYFGEFFYCPEKTMKYVNKSCSKKIAIILNEKDTKPSDISKLLNPCKPYVDLIRLAVNPQFFLRALKLAEKIKKLGFKISFNVMYMSKWRNYNFLNELNNLKNFVDYFYMVDSYGSVYPKDVIKTIDLIRNKTNVKIGFHGHDNLELAHANTLTAIDQGVDIVDSTITGMGRGAGNLKTELLLTSLNSKGLCDFHYNDLSKLVDEFDKVKKDYDWGTNLPYMFSGANSLPQKQVMEWVLKRYYSYNSIIRALKNQRDEFKEDKSTSNNSLNKKNKYSSALIVGGGNSVKTHSSAIKLFLEKNKDIVVIHASSKNGMIFNEINNDQYFCLVGNEGHRLENVFYKKKIKGKCILPPRPRPMGTYIPKKMKNDIIELKKITFTKEFKDSHTSIALQSVIDFGINNVFIVGYDGYYGKNITEREQELFFENQSLFKFFKKYKLKISSITPTKYTKLNVLSIYSFL